MSHQVIPVVPSVALAKRMERSGADAWWLREQSPAAISA